MNFDFYKRKEQLFSFSGEPSRLLRGVERFGIALLLLFLVLPVMLHAQQRQVTGRVVDQAGQPVAGATVSVDGTTTGTITNPAGEFSLTMRQAGVLKVSFVGYITQTVHNLDHPHIVLEEDVLDLDEVVVVGYGTQRMRNVTGSISVIKPEDIQDLPMMNLGAGLKGLVPGLSVKGGEARPGKNPTIELHYGQSPIYVIDDIVYSQNKADGAEAFNNLDPYMIESITILKDGAAAVYGASSGMGAILVKTRRGEVGPVKISYNGAVSMADEIKRPKMLNAYDYGILKNRMVAHSWQADKDIANRQTALFQAEELEMMRNMNYDWLDNAWSAAYDTKHNINISGGTENATFFAGLSYASRGGNLGLEEYERWNVRAGVDAKLNNHLKASLTIGGDWARNEQTWNKIGTENEDNDYNTLLQTPRHIPWELYDEFGNRHFLTRSDFENKLPGNTALNVYNWYAMQELDNRVSKRPVNMSINGSVSYDFGWSELLKGLGMKVRYSKTFHNDLDNRMGTYVDLTHLKQRGGSGGHLWVDEGPFLGDVGGRLMHEDNINPVKAKNDNRIYRYVHNKEQYQVNFDATYSRTFGLHGVSAVFSIERMELETRKQALSKNDPIPNYTGEFTGALGSVDATSERHKGGGLGYVGRLDYDYNNRYLFSFLVRSDASTKFSPENYWGTFYSLSAGWVISEEDFFQSVSWIDFLKIRAGWSLTGTDNTDSWSWMQKFAYHHDKGPVLGGDTNRQFAMHASGAPNRNGHWDKKYKHSLGIDARFLRSRLSVAIDGYFDRGRDLLVQRSASIPITLGANLAKENYNAQDNYGIDLSLSWRDKIGEVGYTIRVNTGWSDGRARKRDWPVTPSFNSVVKDGPLSTGTWGYDAIGILRTEEEIDDYFREHKIKKYFNTDVTTQEGRDKMFPGMVAYRDVRGQQNPDGSYDGPDGEIDSNDQIRLARRTQIGGANMHLGLSWKNFTLNARFSASWGGYPQIGTRPSKSGLDLTNVPVFWNDMFHFKDIADANGNIVAPANLNGKWPNPEIKNTTETSSIWHVPSFRMYLNNATVGYTFPKEIVEKINIASLRLTLTGTNLISFVNPWPNKYYNQLQGYTGYPTTRVLSMGVNIGF